MMSMDFRWRSRRLGSRAATKGSSTTFASGSVTSSGIRRGRKVGSLVDSMTMVDRKSTRLNSSHVAISYAVFCLKKKTDEQIQQLRRQGVLVTTRGQRTGFV